MNEKELCKEAIDAMKNAYAPYSGYKVGAALLTEKGKLFAGCNIENAAYTPTVCAERVALFNAISSGERNFTAIAVAGGKDGVISGAFPPCGVCRQVMAEFCAPDFTVLVVTGEDSYKKYTLNELFPQAFTPKNIE
ncbi:cytidine deaminase [Ruminococcus sp. CAG:563]|nr:cytidine deaminase [Ruminococcus sp. CAG:563]HJI46009.1 cytidine deaminase [Oscillospiraceae bacterium]